MFPQRRLRDIAIEPEALAAKLATPNLTVEERAAITRGLSRRGKAILGDVAPNRNDGKAMGDAIATENNLARIGQVAGSDAADKVRSMAAREDLFAKDPATMNTTPCRAFVHMGATIPRTRTSVNLVQTRGI